MRPISCGFAGRCQPEPRDLARSPSGKDLTYHFPVLRAGLSPRVDLDHWTFEITDAVEQPVSLTWPEVGALPLEEPALRGLRSTERDRLGFCEVPGYHDHGDPWLLQLYQGD
jgi:DMSO/TMAO reductase YedYZ molybdopterin-dependent catalytic subunit